MRQGRQAHDLKRIAAANSAMALLRAQVQGMPREDLLSLVTVARVRVALATFN